MPNHILVYTCINLHHIPNDHVPDQVDCTEDAFISTFQAVADLHEEEIAAAAVERCNTIGDLSSATQADGVVYTCLLMDVRVLQICICECL